VGALLYGALKRQAFVAVLERIRGTLERYLAPELVEKIVREPEALATRTTLDEVTVVFSDIRGFTELAEKTPPDVVSEMLSEHLAAMAEAVFAHGGMVDKYLGDAVMAVFGAPFPQPDHARRAFATALEMQARQRQVAARWAGRLGRTVEIGIGIHSGPVTVGDVGHQRRAEYAVVGDTVNVASRLKDLARAGEILASDAAARAAGEGFSVRPAETLAVRGRSTAVTSYVLIGTDRARLP
jgi:adenylate cyclase